MDAVTQMRRFNRTVTQRVGVLTDSFLATDRPLGAARVLWEIGDGVEVRALRARLELDSGYLSRLLRSLVADGLVELQPDPADRRVRTARLTAAGAAERRELDRRSDQLAGSILATLSERQQARLVAAMGEVERLLTASMVEVAMADAGQPEARACLAAYFAELAERLDAGYDPAASLPADLTPPAGLFLVAALHGEAVGCVGLKLPAGAPPEIKRMWVSPAVRGLGLGRRLLTEIEGRAAEHGATSIRLETSRNLTEAIALYRSAGYREVQPFNAEPFAHHWFAKQLS